MISNRLFILLVLSPQVYLFLYGYNSDDLLCIYCRVFQGVHCWASQRHLLMAFAGMWSAVIRPPIRLSEFQLRNRLCATHGKEITLYTCWRGRNTTLGVHEGSSDHEDDMETDDVCLQKRHLRQPLPVSDVSHRKWKSHGSPFLSESGLV